MEVEKYEEAQSCCHWLLCGQWLLEGLSGELGCTAIGQVSRPLAKMARGHVIHAQAC